MRSTLASVKRFQYCTMEGKALVVAGMEKNANPVLEKQA